MNTGKHELVRAADLSFLETQIVREKAKGLSNLEVALKLFLYERDVRAITQRLKKRHYPLRRLRNGPGHAAS